MIRGAAAGGLGPITLSAAWSDIAVASPSTSGTNEDRTLTFAGAARNISASSSFSVGALQYRLDSGSWTAYGSAFSITSGQTLGWRWASVEGNQAQTAVTVLDASRGAELDSFNLTSTGF